MKLLASTTLLFLLVIGFSGGVSGQSFEETKRLAEQGDVYAQTVLGLMYARGEGVPENDAEAVKWYRLAAEQGNEGARGNSEEGENGGIEPSTRGFSVDSVTDSLIESMS